MALYYDLPIYKACYRLLLCMFSITRDFKREFKYTIGQEMKKNSMQLVIYIFKANSSQDKIPDLNAMTDSLEILKLQLRLCVDLHIVTPSKQANIWQEIDIIGKQLSGWKKASGGA